jgi:hypothetical protein
MYYTMNNEKSDLDAKATTYGITTEKTNYDNAFTALTNYLATLTSPVDWDNTAGNTTINATTFRNDFIDVLYRKQLLINKITAQAKVLADAAQSTANTAQSTASTAQSTANTAQTTAATAQSTASSASTTATAAKTNDAISASWTSPGSILIGFDTGASGAIAIENHTRKYGDATSVAVTGNTVDGLAYGATYYIYYDDPTRAGGSVTFHATGNPNTALPNAATGRHYCGSTTTPASGGGDTSGGAGFGAGDIAPGAIP